MVAGYMPHVRVVLLLEDRDVKTVLTCLGDSPSELQGDVSTDH